MRGERWGSNPRPPGPQPGALPTELRPPRVEDRSLASGSSGSRAVDAAIERGRLCCRPDVSAGMSGDLLTARSMKRRSTRSASTETNTGARVWGVRRALGAALCAALVLVLAARSMKRRSVPTASTGADAGAHVWGVRTALGAVLCAALVLVFAPLGAGQGASVASVPLSVSVEAAHPGPPIPQAFLGLSFELSSLSQIARYAESGDLVTLLRSLGPGVLRFGGVSAEHARRVDRPIHTPTTLGVFGFWKQRNCASLQSSRKRAAGTYWVTIGLSLTTTPRRPGARRPRRRRRRGMARRDRARQRA